MAATSALRTQGPCKMLTFALVITGALFNGEYLEEKKILHPKVVSLERLAAVWWRREWEGVREEWRSVCLNGL